MTSARRLERKMLNFFRMSTIGEIETAIENLPLPEVEALALWLEAYRARGAARPGVTTAEVMALTRGDE